MVKDNLGLCAIVQSDTTVFNPPLVGMYVMKAGTLVIVTEDDASLTLVFPAAADGGSYPFHLKCAVRKVMDTNTTLTDADLFGIKN